MSPSLYDIALTRGDGRPATLGEYRGQVLLIVNVASRCGLTPQYTGLEALYRSHHGRGLQVLGFPCNDFAAQEPGSEAEILAFCASTHGVGFPLFAKLRINSAPRHALYAALIEAQPRSRPSGSDQLRSALAQHGLLTAGETDVMWNLTSRSSSSAATARCWRGSRPTWRPTIRRCWRRSSRRSNRRRSADSGGLAEAAILAGLRVVEIAGWSAGLAVDGRSMDCTRRRSACR